MDLAIARKTALPFSLLLKNCLKCDAIHSQGKINNTVPAVCSNSRALAMARIPTSVVQMIPATKDTPWLQSPGERRHRASTSLTSS